MGQFDMDPINNPPAPLSSIAEASDTSTIDMMEFFAPCIFFDDSSDVRIQTVPRSSTLWEAVANACLPVLAFEVRCYGTRLALSTIIEDLC